VEDAADPWSTANGTGFANDVVREAFAAVHVDIKFRVQPYSRCKANLMAGAVAACLSMSWLPEFKGKVVFSKKPLFVCQSDYYYDTTKPLKAKSEAEIPAGSIVGIVPGYEYPSGVATLKKRGIVLDESGTEESNLKKVALGRLDFAIVNHNNIKPVAKTIITPETSAPVGFAFKAGSLESFIGFSPKNPKGEWARKKFDAGHDIIIRNGTVHRLELKWAAGTGSR